MGNESMEKNKIYFMGDIRHKFRQKIVKIVAAKIVHQGQQR